MNLIPSLDGRETKRGKAFLLAYFFRLPPTLQDEYVSVDVLHTDPAGEAQGRVCPHPVHHSPQLSQKGNEAEPARNHILLERQLWGGPVILPTPGAHVVPYCFSPYDLGKILKVTLMVKLTWNTAASHLKSTYELVFSILFSIFSFC